MPLTIVDKDTILAREVSYVLAGNIISDLAPISVVRQMLEGDSSNVADLYYALWSLQQGWYVLSAEGIDLDRRGTDMGRARDPGQAASDPVTFTKTGEWIDDIRLPSPQVVSATLADGTQVLYRSLQDMVLQPSGRSISGQAPATSITAGVNDRIIVNLDGDGLRTLILGTQTTGAGIAAAIQAAVLALTANNATHQPAYTNLRCDYNVTTAGAYTLRVGTAGPTSSVVVTPSGANNGTVVLKLGLASGGTEQVGQGSLDVPVICDTIGVRGNVGAGQVNQLVSSVPGIASVANPLMFVNGSEPASDDAYRQDIQAWLKSLGRGNPPSVEEAVRNTKGADGQRHVQSFQVLSGASTVQVYLCDGRSLTVGCQTDTIQDVQDELDGLGAEPGGWIACGNTAAVVSVTVLPMPVSVTATIGPKDDPVQAQRTLATTIYQTQYGWGVGESMSYKQLVEHMDAALSQLFDAVFTQPSQFATSPYTPFGGQIGTKIMPSTITVTIVQA